MRHIVAVSILHSSFNIANNNNVNFFLGLIIHSLYVICECIKLTTRWSFKVGKFADWAQLWEIPPKLRIMMDMFAIAFFVERKEKKDLQIEYHKRKPCASGYWIEKIWSATPSPLYAWRWAMLPSGDKYRVMQDECIWILWDLSINRKIVNIGILAITCFLGKFPWLLLNSPLTVMVPISEPL